MALTVTKMDVDNITRRKKNKNFNLSNIELFNMDRESVSETLNSSSRSLPTSYADLEEVGELKKEISNINKVLEIAHKEIEILNMNNEELRTLLQKSENKIKYLKSLCLDVNSKSENRQSSNSTPLKNKDYYTPTFRRIASSIKQLQFDQSPLKVLQLSSSEPGSPIKDGSATNNIGNSTPKNHLMDDTILSSQNDTHEPAFKNTLLEQINNADDLEIEKKLGSCKYLPLEKSHTENFSKKKLIIIGNEHVAGLAAEIHDSRKGKWNDNYLSYGNIKPYATTEEVLQYCDKVETTLTKKDTVVISIGNHDTSPHSTYSALCIALYKLRNTNVIVLPVIKNPSLNENLLNENLQLLCKNFDNCNFIALNSIHTNYHHKNKKNYVKEICNIINVAIDYSEYKLQYLTFENLIKNRNLIGYFQVSAQEEKKRDIIKKSLDRVNDAVFDNNSEIFFRS